MHRATVMNDQKTRQQRGITTSGFLWAACRVAGLVLLLAGCSPAPVERVSAKQDGLHFLNTDPDVAYVGEQACVRCHVEESMTFDRTGMGRAFYPMTPDEIVEDWTDDNELVIEATGLHYRMERRGDKFYQRQFILDSRGNEIAADQRELIFALGSGNHSRGYVTEVEGKLFQAPVCWYPAEQLWEMCPGYEIMNDHFVREISQGCIHCHNDVMELIEGERNEYRKPYPHGIGCERCHGPGQLHVERWEKGETPTGEFDPTIVHVRRLPREERIEVCFQCHLGDAKASERVMRWDRDVTAFRPGQKLSEVVVAFRMNTATQHDFGLTGQVDRMLLSRCYTESGGQLECLTCHNPHVSVYRENRPDDFFRRPCLSCHAVEDCGESPDVRAQTEPAADDCWQCHMRKAEADDQRFAVFTDHWIRKNIDVEQDHRENYDFSPLFPDRFASLPRGEQAFYEARAGSLMASRNPFSDHLQEMRTDSEASFERAIEEGFDSVYAWFFLGKVRLILGKPKQAEQAFERAHALDPEHHDAAFALGQARMRRRDPAAAVEIFNTILERDPEDAMTLAEVGRAMSVMGRHEEALSYYDRAIVQEPWAVSLHVNQGRVYAALGRFDEAAAKAIDAVKLNPEDAKIWQFYEKAHEAAGDMEAAAEGRRLYDRLSKVQKVSGHAGMM